MMTKIQNRYYTNSVTYLRAKPNCCGETEMVMLDVGRGLSPVAAQSPNFRAQQSVQFAEPRSMTSETPIVYISYCRSSEPDLEWAKKLAHFLRSEGIQTLLDAWELRPGMDMLQWYQESAEVSDIILLIASQVFVEPRSFAGSRMDSDVFLDALSGVLRVRGVGKKLLIPLLFPGVPPDELPPSFSNRVGIPVDPDNTAPAFSALLDAINGRQTPIAPLVRARGKSPRDSSVPVLLQHIRIKNFRRIRFLELTRAVPDELAIAFGQWTLLLGDNGAGKSSFLWALGLGLLEREMVHGILANLSTSLIQNSLAESEVIVLEAATRYFLLLKDDQDRERIVHSFP